MRHLFPPVAVVNGDRILKALAIGLISPDIHTILIRGPVGSGKSVIARGIEHISGDRRVVEMPPGIAVEDLFGSMDIEVAISTGKKRISDSLLERANGNILIADNINLQSKEVLHTLLNAVLEGKAVGEISGVSVNRCFDTLLIGTMDPAEETLDEVLMDKFDICVDMDPIVFPEDRREVILRSLHFEKDPGGFISSFSEQTSDLISKIRSAECEKIEIPEGLPTMISEISREMFVEGHRGDIATMNVARASAALEGRPKTTQDDLKCGVIMCLQHRRREIPPPPVDEENDIEPDGSEVDDPEKPNQEDHGQSQPDCERPSEPDDTEHDENHPGPSGDTVFEVGEKFDVRDYIPPENRNNRNRRSGRQDSSLSKDGTGRTIGYMIPRGKVRDIALVPSIRAAAPYQRTRNHSMVAIALERNDLRDKVRVKHKGTTVLFVVDGSGSMGAQSRMVAVKGAILSMLDDAYKRRNLVGLVIFKGESAEEILQPTRSILTAYRTMEELPVGGKTPLYAGIQEGYRILSREARSGLEPVMVILTDGRGNVKPEGCTNLDTALKDTSEAITDAGIRTIVVDTEIGLVRFGKAMTLASMLDATYIQLEDLDARNLSTSVKMAMNAFE